MYLRKALGVFGTAVILAALTSLPARADKTDDFIAQAKTDLQAITDSLNGAFGKSLGFFSTLGWSTPPSVFDLVTGPRFEIGLAVGADFMKLPDLNGIPLGALVGDSNVKLPSGAPLPFPVATARLGLLNGLDVGFRYDYLPQISLPDLGLDAHYTGWGLDLRYRILDGAAVPALTVDATWDNMNGAVALRTDVNQSSTFNGGNVTVAGSTRYALNWNVKSFGARLTVGKDLGIVYPFAAVGFQRNSGDVTSVTTPNAVVTTSDPAQNYTTPAVSDANPVVLEPKFVLGFDTGKGFQWAVLGESNGTDIAGSTSFRVQF